MALSIEQRSDIPNIYNLDAVCELCNCRLHATIRFDTDEQLNQWFGSNQFLGGDGWVYYGEYREHRAVACRSCRTNVESALCTLLGGPVEPPSLEFHVVQKNIPIIAGQVGSVDRLVLKPHKSRYDRITDDEDLV